MSSLFETQNEVTESDCDAYAQNLVGTSVKPVAWQGYHSYTLMSGSGVIIQFRSKSSPLDISMTALAKAVHPHLAPATTYRGLMPKSSVSIWMMELLPGTFYLSTGCYITAAKLDTTVIDLAKFYASSWRKPQDPGGFYASSWRKPQDPGGEISQRYKAELMQLSGALSGRLTTIIERTLQIIDKIICQVPWVLSHWDLSDMNILVDPDTGHLTGVVDWAEASIEPFGITLWGLESVLGWTGPQGYSYYGNDVTQTRRLFRTVLFTEMGGVISNETRKAIEELRTLGLLIRYGFDREVGSIRPTRDTTHLELFLQSRLLE